MAKSEFNDKIDEYFHEIPSITKLNDDGSNDIDVNDYDGDEFVNVYDDDNADVNIDDDDDGDTNDGDGDDGGDNDDDAYDNDDFDLNKGHSSLDANEIKNTYHSNEIKELN